MFLEYFKIFGVPGVMGALAIVVVELTRRITKLERNFVPRSECTVVQTAINEKLDLIRQDLQHITDFLLREK